MTPIISVSGDGLTRGRQHGEQARGLAQDHMRRWLDALGSDLGLDPRAYLDRFLADTHFLPAIERYTPDLLDEVRGIAEGAALPFDLVYARALSDEEPWYRRAWLKRASSDGETGCSAIIVEGDEQEPAIIAQNMDVPSWWDGTQMLLRLHYPSGHDVLVFTVAGKISLAGLNSAGLAMACMTLSQLDYSATGLPEDFVVRGFLGHDDFPSALAWLHAIPHASGQAYAIGAPGHPPRFVEASAKGVVEVPRVGSPVHTNHPVASNDTALFAADTMGMDADSIAMRYSGTSRARAAALSARAHPTSAHEVMEALALHEGPVCRHGELEGRRDGFTLGSLVMRLATAPTLDLAPGPPCRTPFDRYGF